MTDPWATTDIVAFRQAAKACFLAGESYRELKDILATEEELYKEQRERGDASQVQP